MGTATATEKEMKEMQVAVITYNCIGDGQYENGVTDAPGIRLFIAQNGHKSKWAADPDYGDYESRQETRKHMARAVANMVQLADMDHVFIYVGSSGGEEAIRISRDLPAHKVSYVMCGCNWGHKLSLIRDTGNVGARIIKCQCGGRYTLASIVKRLLAGTKPSAISS